MRVKITLACTECKQRNYNMTKEKKNHPERMETKKYCRFCKRHTMQKETKSCSLTRGASMTEPAKNSKKKSWFAGLKSEFKKIIWADNKTLAKQTSIVVVVTAVLGVLISLIDSVVLQLVNLIIK